MASCSMFGCEGDDDLAYRCNECGLQFCTDHRLPENHRCRGLVRDGDPSGKRLATGLAGANSTPDRGDRETADGHQHDHLDVETLGTAGDLEELDPVPAVQLDLSPGRSQENADPDRSGALGFRVRWATWLYRLVALVAVLLTGYVLLTLTGVI